MRRNTHFDEDILCVKSVRIRSFPGLCFTAFGLNMDQIIRIQSELRKIRSTKTPNTDTFHAMTHIQVRNPGAWR